VVIEDQADDFTTLSKETDDADLWIRCPYCDSPQNFTLKGFYVKRKDDFKAVLPKEKTLEILRKYGCENQIEEVMQWQRENRK